jgi:hypothetical protein
MTRTDNRDDGRGEGRKAAPRRAEPSPEEFSAVGRAWAAWATDLAKWTMKWLVNRTDAWGAYRPFHRRQSGAALTQKGELTQATLVRHYEGAQVADLVGLHTTSARNSSRWLAIDIDWHGPRDPEKQRQLRGAARALWKRARALAFDPLLIASNGKGGYHVILIFDRPVPTEQVHAFARWLVRDWQALGLTDPPEVFPKQARLGPGVKYGNWLRLPGRHHTAPYFSEVWTGRHWASGEAAIRLILAARGVSPDRIPAEALQAAAVPPQAAPAPTPGPAPEALSPLQRRALALLQRLRAVQGQGGDKVTWTAALYLVKDFALDVEQALPVLRAWNASHCHPPWHDADLLRKLERAEQEPGPRGRLLGDAPGSTAPEAPGEPAEPSGPPFAVEVPDFTLADWSRVQPDAQPARRGRGSPVRDVLWTLIRAAVIRQASSRVFIPDVVVAQVLWGGDHGRWPRRWRRALRRRLDRVMGPWRLHGACPETCPLHGRPDLPHRHLRSTLKKHAAVLGLLHAFSVGADEDSGVHTYDFRGWQSHHPDPEEAARAQERIDQGRKAGRLCSIYLPAWLFGPVVLAPGPCRILQALTRELTRTRGRHCDRPDRAEVLRGAACRLLDRARRYVGFNGNGRARYRGRGYQLRTWLARAGYALADRPARWAQARRFLRDLQALGEPLGLVAGGFGTQGGEWQPLDRLLDLTRTAAGRTWLKQCRLKIYGPEDYLTAWRRYFARALGFCFIPGGSGEAAGTQTPGAGPAATPTSALELDVLMRRNDLTERALAEQLGVTQALVSYMRSGRRPWSAAFQERLGAFCQAPHRR